jgi:hypothetical protein
MLDRFPILQPLPEGHANVLFDVGNQGAVSAAAHPPYGARDDAGVAVHECGELILTAVHGPDAASYARRPDGAVKSPIGLGGLRSSAGHGHGYFRPVARESSYSTRRYE